MEDIRNIQYKKIRQVYQELIRKRDELPSTNKIRQLLSEIIYSVERVPLSGNYRLTGYEHIDINSLCAEIGTIKADFETIYEYLSSLSNRLKDIEYISQIWREYSKNKIVYTLLDIMKLSSPIYIKGFTEDIDTNAQADRDQTTLTVLDDGTITLSPISNITRPIKYKESDIHINKIGSDLLSANIEGQPTNILNIGEYGGLVMSLNGNYIGESGFRIEIKTNAKDINHISLNIGEESAGIKLTVEISKNRKEYTSVFEQVVKRNRVDIPIDKTDIGALIITMTMDFPNITMLNNAIYSFRLYKVMLLEATKRTSGSYQTVEIPIENDIGYFSIVPEEEVIGDVDVRYYISTNKDTDNKAIGFVNIDPTKSDSLISMANTVTNISVTPSEDDPRWKIHPTKQSGSKLYNIFDCNYTYSSDDYTIDNGKISFANDNYHIIPDTIKLYRGSKDYIKKEKTVSLDVHVEPINYRMITNELIEWVDPVPLRVRHKELIDKKHIYDSGDCYRNRILIDWKIENIEDIEIRRDDGVEVYTYVSDIHYILQNEPSPGAGYYYSIEEYRANYSNIPVSSTYVTFTGIKDEIVLEEKYHHYVIFTTSLTQYILKRNVDVDIDISSFKVEILGDEISRNIDYRVHPNEYKVELLKTGTYAYESGVNFRDDYMEGKPVEIVISYDFKETSSTSATYYETNLYVSIPTNIIILPFTAAEIADGNFHYINDKNISISHEFILKQGWNNIKTTHPYPSVNEYDLNKLTNSPSNAGIIIPDNIENMRPYLDSMRHVSPFILATVEPEEGNKCFSFTNNKIYVNFLPDFVEQDILNDEITVGTKGEIIIGKKPILEPDYSNTGYISQPEIFEIEFIYKDDSKEKFAFVRIEMELISGSSTARINRIGINKYQEVN